MNSNALKLRLKGFTLTEIIIAMILSGILLGMAIKVILSVQSVGILQNKTSSQNSNLLSISTVLKENFLNSSSIEANNNDELIFSYPQGKFIKIAFHPGYVIISNLSMSDTIQVQCENLSITKLDPASPYVYLLSFGIKYNSIVYPVFIKKEYSNQVLYNIN